MRQLRRFLLQTRLGRLIFAIVTAVATAAVAVAVLGGFPQLSDSTSSTLPRASHEGCTSGPADAEVRVTIYGGGEASCAAFNMGAGRASESVWQLMPVAARETGRQLVCSMGKDGLILEVRDTNSHFYGNKICARLTAQGWQKQQGPGSTIERERDAQRAKETARPHKEETQRYHKGSRQHEPEAGEHQKEDAERAGEYLR
jgi:hypothetical protein